MDVAWIKPLALDGGEIIVAYDLDTGERVPLVVKKSVVAAPSVDPRKKSQVVQAWARSRLTFSHRYVVLLTNQIKMKSAAGPVDYARSAGMNVALGLVAPQTIQETKLRDAYQESLQFLLQQGWNVADMLSMTFFTTRSEESVTRPLLDMMNIILSRDHQITDLVEREPFGSKTYGLKSLNGKVSLTNFRDLDGGVTPPYEPISLPQQESVELLLTLPKIRDDQVGAVSIYVHGLGSYKEYKGTIYTRNDTLGIATVAIDNPNHGSRIKLEAGTGQGYVYLVGPKYVPQLLGMMVQTVLDQISLYDAIKTSLVDRLNDYSAQQNITLPHIDTNKFAYDGISLGSMTGLATAAILPDLTGAYLVAGSGGLMHVFSESTFWDGGTSLFIPLRASGAEATFQLAMMQHYVDIADGMNFAHFYRHPPAGIQPRPLAMQYSLGDGSVPNAAIEAAAEVVGLPQIDKVLKPIEYLPGGGEGVALPQNGYGLYQTGWGIGVIASVIATIADLEKQLYLELDTKLIPLLNDTGLDKTTFGKSIEKFVYEVLQSGSTLAPSEWVTLLFKNRITDFYTHFNRNNDTDLLWQREWKCAVLEIDRDLCDRLQPSSTVKNSTTTDDLTAADEGGEPVDTTEINPATDTNNRFEETRQFLLSKTEQMRNNDESTLNQSAAEIELAENFIVLADEVKQDIEDIAAQSQDSTPAIVQESNSQVVSTQLSASSSSSSSSSSAPEHVGIDAGGTFDSVTLLFMLMLVLSHMGVGGKRRFILPTFFHLR